MDTQKCTNYTQNIKRKDCKMKKRRRLTRHEKMLEAASYLTLAGGWEVIPCREYLRSSPEERKEKMKKIRAAVEKALEDL